MRIIVNSGNVGTLVALELARSGHQVSLTVRAPKPNPEWDQLGIKQVPFDINKPDSMAAVIEGHEAFFSLTPLVENFIAAGTNALKAAKQAGISKIVRASAQGAGPDGRMELSRWHYAVETVLEATGIPFTVLRPANFMQNYLGFGIPETIKSQSAFHSSLGDGKVSPVDTRDISAVAARVLVESGHDGKRYELTGGESFSDAEAAEVFSRLLGRKIRHVSITDGQERQAMQGAGIPGWLTNLVVELHRVERAGYLAAVSPEVENILKRRPISFEQFLKDHLHVFRS